MNFQMPTKAVYGSAAAMTAMTKTTTTATYSQGERVDVCRVHERARNSEQLTVLYGMYSAMAKLH